jgi:hypothetical protein
MVGTEMQPGGCFEPRPPCVRESGRLAATVSAFLRFADQCFRELDPEGETLQQAPPEAFASRT